MPSKYIINCQIYAHSNIVQYHNHIYSQIFYNQHMIEQHIPQNPIQQKIDIRYIYNKNHKSNCSYCKNKTQTEFRFSASKMTPLTSELLADKGWARYETDYFKPYLQTTCCKQWARRMDVTQFRIKKQQSKTMRKCIRFFMGKKIKQPQQHNEQQQNIFNKQKNNNNQNIPEHILQQLKEITKTVHSIFIQNLQLIGEKIIEKTQIIQLPTINYEELKEMVEKVKYFVSKTPKQAPFYSNYSMLMYGMYKKHFTKESKLTMNDFGDIIQSILGYQGQKYETKVSKSGYFSYKQKQQMKEVKQQRKNKEKQRKRQKMGAKKEEMEEKMQKKSKIMKNDDKLDFQISQDTIKCGNLIIRIQKSEYSQQKFALWDNYRAKVHGKPNNNVQGFKDFICHQGLIYQQIPTTNSTQKQYKPIFCSQIQQTVDKKVIKRMGCYHMNYYYDNRLIGVNSVNILPYTLQSQYFFYSPQLKFQQRLRMGVFSAIVDIQYVRWMNLSFPQFRYYNMCYFIQNCQKMSYKSQYQPFQILCPITYRWIPYTAELKQKIDKIDKKETECLRLAAQNVQIDDDMVIGEDFDVFAVENLNLRINDENTFAAYQFNIMQNIEDLCRNLGKKLSAMFVWELKGIYA